jgi:TolB-like protein/Flp pilus assembly protein TadD
MIALLAALAFQCPDGSPPPCGRPAASHAAAATAPSVAVLYFDNLSRDTDDAYLADGLTEQTIAQLGEVNRLTVSSRYAVRRFRGNAAPQDPAAIGRALKVAYLVTGSVQRSGVRLRVDVELLRAGTGVRVWGDQYDRTTTDILQLQDDIAAAVATGIVGRLLPTERSAIATRTTRIPAAYDQFLRGNFYLAQRTPSGDIQALRSYQAAVNTDPRFTDALARVAYTYGNALDDEFDIGIPRDSLVRLGVETARRAVALDSLSSEAWLAMAYITMAEKPRTFEGVRQFFEHAIRLNPRSAEAHHQFGSFLQYWGDTTAARLESERALELEPGRAITWFGMAEIAMVRGEPREALRLDDSAFACDPRFRLPEVNRFMAAIALGDTALARTAASNLLREPGYQPVGAILLSFLAALANEPGARDRFARDTVSVSPTDPGNSIAWAYRAAFDAHLGNKEASLADLERAKPRGIRLHDYLRRSDFDAYRSDPRFQALYHETMPPGMSW